MTGIDALTAEVLDGLPIVAEVATTPPNLAPEWWQERPELARIRQAAHDRTVSADAVLGAVLARVAVLTPPTVRLPAVVGTAGTLDLAVALVAPSGSGKSSAVRVSGDLFPVNRPDVAVVPLGSGEGLIESYLGFVDEVDDQGKTVKVKRQVRTGVLALLDEGQALAEMGGRKGSTLMPTIRSAWTGDQLGQANATEERRRCLPAGEYRFSLIAAFQTDLAVALVDDAAGGTPQRFLFVSATDDAIPDDGPGWPTDASWKPPKRSGQLDIDPAIAGEIRARHLARARGEVVPDPLDAHRDLSRLKVAGLLALLAGRTDIDADDWRLAGDVLDVSDRVRGGIVAAARWRAREAERTHVARLTGRAAALDDDAGRRALIGMAKAIARHVHRATCKSGCKRSCATRSTSGKHREHSTVSEALAEAVTRGWVVVDGDAILPGETSP